MNDHLLWIDLETTGSDPEKDCIIEVGLILTTSLLEEQWATSYVIKPQELGLGRMMLNPIVRGMHEANGLLAEVLDPEGPSWRVHDAASHILRNLIERGAKEGKVVLAGSGVGHFDRAFIRRYMPQLDRYMRYWCIDVGVIRRAYEMWSGDTGPLVRFNEGKTHRALDDIRCHLNEARAFSEFFSRSLVA